MLAYYISQSNAYTFRTQPTGSNQFTMSLQDMYTLQNITMSMASMSYNPYESFVSFTGSISGSYVAAEYRATLYNQGAGTPLLKFNITAGKKPFVILFKCRLLISPSVTANCIAATQSGNE